MSCVASAESSQSADRDLRSDHQGIEYVTDFSSRGPAPNLRIAPDVVSPDHFILSANAVPSVVDECDSTDGYAQLTRGETGTSQDLTYIQGNRMAAPDMMGAEDLAGQYFSDGFYPGGSEG